MTYPLGPGIPQVSANELNVEIWNMLLSDPLVIQHWIESVPNNYYLGPTLFTPDTSSNPSSRRWNTQRSMAGIRL